MDRWKGDLEGGILLEEPYQTSAYKDDNESDQSKKSSPNSAAQERFLNMTYNKGRQNRMTLVTNLDDVLLSENDEILPNRPLNRGSSVGNIVADFDTQKVACHGTLKRLKFQKVNTEPALFDRIKVGEERFHDSAQIKEEEEDNQCGKLINRLFGISFLLYQFS